MNELWVVSENIIKKENIEDNNKIEKIQTLQHMRRRLSILHIWIANLIHRRK